MATNAEKYKDKDSRFEAFMNFCNKYDNCCECPIDPPENSPRSCCSFYWLEIEAKEEKPLPCPFCGSEADVRLSYNSFGYTVQCQNPNCTVNVFTGVQNSKEEAITAWNRRS